MDDNEQLAPTEQIFFSLTLSPEQRAAVATYSVTNGPELEKTIKGLTTRGELKAIFSYIDAQRGMDPYVDDNRRWTHVGAYFVGTTIRDSYRILNEASAQPGGVRLAYVEGDTGDLPMLSEAMGEDVATEVGTAKKFVFDEEEKEFLEERLPSLELAEKFQAFTDGIQRFRETFPDELGSKPVEEARTTIVGYEQLLRTLFQQTPRFAAPVPTSLGDSGN